MEKKLQKVLTSGTASANNLWWPNGEIQVTRWRHTLQLFVTAIIAARRSHLPTTLCTRHNVDQWAALFPNLRVHSAELATSWRSRFALAGIGDGRIGGGRRNDCNLQQKYPAASCALLPNEKMTINTSAPCNRRFHRRRDVLRHTSRCGWRRGWKSASSEVTFSCWTSGRIFGTHYSMCQRSR